MASTTSFGMLRNFIAHFDVYFVWSFFSLGQNCVKLRVRKIGRVGSGIEIYFKVRVGNLFF